MSEVDLLELFHETLTFICNKTWCDNLHCKRRTLQLLTLRPFITTKKKISLESFDLYL